MIVLRDVSKTITEPDGSTRALFDRLDFDLREEDHSVAITGRSGSGKSTLLRILAGLDTDFGGTYEHDGHVLERTARRMAAHRLRHIGIVTQDHSLLSDRSVLDNVRLGVPARADSADRAHTLSRRSASVTSPPSAHDDCQEEKRSASPSPEPSRSALPSSSPMSPPAHWTRRPKTTCSPSSTGCSKREPSS